MSAKDSDTESVVSAGEPTKSLESAGRELVHDVATPLATIQLNLQVLSNYLPRLMGRCSDVDGAPAGINPDHLKALASLPNALDADIRKIRHAVQLFSSILVPEYPAQGQVSEMPMRQDTMTLRILLVEDELIHQEIALKQLVGRAKVDVAATGREALKQVARESYDLVLLDLMLSGQDARGLIAELRASAGQLLRILLVSNMPLSLEDVRQLKADGALEKPFRFVSMESLLQRLELGKPATV